MKKKKRRVTWSCIIRIHPQSGCQTGSGRGYSYDNLKLMRKFYLVYFKDSIGETPFPQSEKLPVTQEGRKFYQSRSHYLILMRINNVDERHFYEIESYRNGWSKEELNMKQYFQVKKNCKNCWKTKILNKNTQKSQRITLRYTVMYRKDGQS